MITDDAKWTNYDLKIKSEINKNIIALRVSWEN